MAILGLQAGSRRQEHQPECYGNAIRNRPQRSELPHKPPSDGRNLRADFLLNPPGNFLKRIFLSSFQAAPPYCLQITALLQWLDVDVNDRPTRQLLVPCTLW